MRLFILTKLELKLLFKEGIIYLYALLGIIYLVILFLIPTEYRTKAGVLLIFTDPAAMGLFFIGLVILLEKSQRVFSSLSVTPIKSLEYVIAKSLAFLLLGYIVSLLLYLTFRENLLAITLSVLLTSVFFSFIAIALALNSASLNGFLALSIGVEILLCGPSVLYFFKIVKSRIWLFHPGVASISLMFNKEVGYSILSLIIWTSLSFLVANKETKKALVENRKCAL